MKNYRVKEIFLTLQGEGARAGSKAVFLRFSGCNLWSGREEDRAKGTGPCAAWCFAPDEPVLLADWTYAPIGSLLPGQRIMCARRVGSKMRLDTTRVLQVLRREAPLARLRFGDGDVIGTADHPVWVRGRNHEHASWVPASDAVGGAVPSLGPPPPIEDGNDWRRGWLAGIAFGDGCFWTLKKRGHARLIPYDRASPWAETSGEYRRFRLAVNDEAIIKVFASFAALAGFEGFYEAPHKRTGFGGSGVMPALWLTRDEAVRTFEQWLHGGSGEAFAAGFLAGTLDAEGCVGKRTLQLAQDERASPENYARIADALRLLGFEFTASARGFNVHPSSRARWRFLLRCRPILERKRNMVLGASLERSTDRLTEVAPLGIHGPVVSLTTGAGNYLLAGHLVKNCDTDFFKGEAFSSEELVGRCDELWPPFAGEHRCEERWVVLTGGEPLLQVTHGLIYQFNSRGWRTALETNGTVNPEEARGIDHVCLSPKHGTPWEKIFSMVRVEEIKVVLPGAGNGDPGWTTTELIAIADKFGDRRQLFVQPEDGKDAAKNAQTCVDFVMRDPRWRVSLQTHKLLHLR